MKSFFIPLTEPLGVIWLLMAAGTVWLLVRRQWRSGVWLGVPTFLIFLIGSTPLAGMLVAQAERPYAASSRSLLDSQSSTVAPQPSFDAIVVLGGGFYPSDHDVRGFVLDGGASRIVTGIELARRGRAPVLVLGGSVPQGDTESVIGARVQEWVESLGMTNFAITNLGFCRTTHDEAMALKRLQETHSWSNILLVTSALHMPRSEALFKKQGFTVTPVACDFRACGVGSPGFHGFSPFPRNGRFDLLSSYLHEKIGWWVYRARNWI